MEALSVELAGGDWFAIQVWSRREHITAKHLRLRGYEVFLPCYRERRRWSDRVKVVEQVLFVGYVFCRFAGGASGRIVTTPGVIGIVGDRSGPLPVLSHEIEAIQRIVETRYSAEPWPMPSIGQKVRIETGPLRGVEGVHVVAKNSHRLVVSISLLHRAVAVEVDSECITMPYATSAV